MTIKPVNVSSETSEARSTLIETLCGRPSTVRAAGDTRLCSIRPGIPAAPETGSVQRGTSLGLRNELLEKMLEVV
jgi:hypothetical protein